MDSALVTFGCSWMWGHGLCYTPGQPREQFNTQRTSEDYTKYSYRHLLAEKLGKTNINFSENGSSNQKQFRLATEFFNTSPPSKDSIVLWGITSTARDEIWYNDRNKYVSRVWGHGYSAHNQLRKNNFDSKTHLRLHYNHSVILKELSNLMLHWNTYFDALGLRNYWVDLFNHHNYPVDIPRLLFSDRPSRDLCSILSTHYGYTPSTDGYHVSQYQKTDSRRIRFLEQQKHVNPHSFHPTRQSHSFFADLIYNEIHH